eukprot:gene756-820_t
MQHDERASMLRDPDIEWVAVKIPSTGLRHYTGIASSYSTTYPENSLRGVITKEEFLDIMTRFNETIRDYWPCHTCYFLGYGCCLCTVGLSVLLPGYCIGHSELYATAILRSFSLKARYYDRNISFTLVKSLCSSYVEIRFPASLLLSQGGEDGGIVMGNTVTGGDIETLSLPPVTSPPLFLSTSHPVRLKEL